MDWLNVLCGAVAFLIGSYWGEWRAGKKNKDPKYDWHCLKCSTSFHTNRQDITLFLADAHMEEFHGKTTSGS